MFIFYKSQLMDVSIIIINYNSSKYTINCIQSIIKHTQDVLYEIIIVDNASKKEDITHLENKLSTFDVTLIKSKTNLGFGGGNHLGYQYAKGNHLAFINNDTLLTENSLLKLLTYSNSNSKVGVLGLKQLAENGKPFKYGYRQFAELKYHLFGQQKPEKYYKKLHKSKLDQPFVVDQVSGAFMFFKTEAYEKVGGFDTNIFLFYEELDVCYRIRKNGYTTEFYPDSSFIHFLGKSSENISIKKEYVVAYLYVIQKNYGYAYYQFLRLVLILKYGIKSIVKPKKHFIPFTIALKGGNSLVYSLKLKN